MDDMVAMLDQGLEHTGRIVDTVQETQWANATLCSEWDARTLLNHLVNALSMFQQVIEKGEVSGDRSADRLGQDPKGAFHRAAEANAKAWREPGVFERTLKLPFGEMPGQVASGICFQEIVVHGLDLAMATQQEGLVDQQLAEDALGVARGMGIDNFRILGVFGPEVPVAADADCHRRLLGYLGRQV